MKAVARESEVQAEDEQIFLARHQSQLQAGGGVPPSGVTPVRQESPLRQSPAVQKSSDRRVSSSSPQNQIGSPKKVSLFVLLCSVSFVNSLYNINYLNVDLLEIFVE